MPRSLELKGWLMAAVTVSIINLKGGVGKSTLTMILGEFLAFRHSKNVLLIDMDAQANLSYCMIPRLQIRRQWAERRTTYHLLRAGLASDDHLDIRDYITRPPLVVSNIARSGMAEYGTDIHMVISTPDIAQLDSDLLDMWAEGRPMPRQVRRTLLRAIEPVTDTYDYILIDCPPGLSVFSSAALVGSDYYISPIIPEPLSLEGVDLVQTRQAQLRLSDDAKAEFRGVILNVVKHYRNTHSRVAQEIYSADRRRYAPFDYWLPDNEQLRRIGEYDPDMEGKWAAGMEHKFANIYDKYGQSHRLANPRDGLLSRQQTEGSRYRIQDRISNLVEEFMKRCPPRQG